MPVIVVVSIVSIAEPYEDRDDDHPDAPAYQKKDHCYPDRVHLVAPYQKAGNCQPYSS